MAEAVTDLSNTVFVDVASGSQYPIVQVTEEVKTEQNNHTTISTLPEAYHPQSNRLRCPECKRYTAETEEKMLRHIRKIHRGENPFQCFMCDYSTYNKVLFEEHVRIHQEQSRKIRCLECKRYTAETEEKMLRHIRKIHRGKNPFQCFMCDYSTYNKVLFEEHVRIHQGIKPYKCSHCPYRSVSKKNTKKHELIHRPDNPHKCEQCGFIARHVKALKHHKLSHGQVVKECSVCGEEFKSVKAYNSHRKSRKRCPECKDMFCVSLFSQHMLEVHGIEKKERKPATKKFTFSCALCKWEGSSKPRILLHLIHHPNQEVDENVVDTLILRELGIMADPSQLVV